jgi:hypothetical protein
LSIWTSSASRKTPADDLLKKAFSFDTFIPLYGFVCMQYKSITRHKY